MALHQPGQGAISPTILAGRDSLNQMHQQGASHFEAGKLYWDGRDSLIQVKAASGRDVTFIDLCSAAKPGTLTFPLSALRAKRFMEVEFQPGMLLRNAIEASQERLTTRQADLLMRFDLNDSPVGSRTPMTEEKMTERNTVDQLIERGMLQVISNGGGSRTIALTRLRGLPRTRRLRGQPPLMDITEKVLKTPISR